MADTTIYVIDNTAGEETAQITIQPRTFNGPGGIQQNTDITLYGNAAPNWGERFNENFYRLLENFACPQKQQSGNPVPQTDAVDELGDGHGINNPVRGQLWYNTTDNNLYAYNGGTWFSIGGGSSGIDISDVNGLEAALNDRVARAGDRMSGPLEFGTGDIGTGEERGSGANAPYLRIGGIAGSGGGNINQSNDIYANAAMNIAADQSIHLIVDGDNDGTGGLTVRKGTYFHDTSTVLFNIENGGTVRQRIDATTYATQIATDDNALPNKKYVDDLVASVSGGGAAVISVNGQSGVVTLDFNDVGAAAASHNHDTLYYRKNQVDVLFDNYYTKAESDARFTTPAEVNALIAGASSGGGVTVFNSGVAVTPTGSFTNWGVITAPASVPSGATAVYVAGINPVDVNDMGSSGTDYSEQPWQFRKTGGTTILSSGSSGDNSVVGQPFGPVLVPLTTSKTFQARRTTNGGGSLAIIGYVS